MRKTILKLFFLTATSCIIFISRTNQSGPGAGYTNAPSESNCTSCHVGTLQTSGTNWGKINLTTNFTGNGYIPDSSYTLVFGYKQTGNSKWGFQITALDASTGSPQGTFSSADSRTQSYLATVGGKTRSYLGHTSTGTSSVTTDSTSWNIKWKAPNSNVGNIVFYAVINVANGNGNELGDVIYAKKFTFGPSSLLPTCKVKIKDSVYCSNAQLTFDATTTQSPTSYSWTFPSGSPTSSTAQNPKVTYTSTGSKMAILRVKNSKGFSQPDTLNFTVLLGASLPNIIINGSTITSNTTYNLCKGDSVAFNSKVPSGNTLYQWSTGAATSSIKVKDTGVYTVTVKNSNNCYRTSSFVHVLSQPKPSISIIKDFSGDTICEGYPFSLGVLVNSGPADSFSFTSGTGPWSKKDTQQRMLTSGPVTMSAWAKSTVGCISPASSVTVQVKLPEAAPLVTVTNVTFTSMRFQWTSVNGATAYKISLDTGKTWIKPSSGDTGHYHDVSGLIGNTSVQALVIGITNGACNKSLEGSATGTTNTCSSIPFTLSTAKSKVCKNGTTTVVIHGLQGKTIGVKVEGVFKGTDTVQTVTVTGTKGYQLSVIDSSALICGYTNKNITLFEDTVNTPQWVLGSKVSYCNNGSTVSLPVVASKDATVDSILYMHNNALEARTTSTSHTFTVHNSDSVWLVGENKRGCLSATGAKSVVVINPIPDASFTNTNVKFNYHFKAKQTGGTQQWKADTASRSGDSAIFDFTNYATKNVKIVHTITVNGCSSSDSVTLSIPDYNGVKIPGLPGAKVYPNPAKDVINVVLPSLNGIATIQFYNSLGQMIYKTELRQGANSIKTLQLPGGLINYVIVTSTTKTTGSIVIER